MNWLQKSSFSQLLTTCSIFIAAHISKIYYEKLGSFYSYRNLSLAQMDYEWAAECQDKKVAMLAPPLVAAQKNVKYFVKSPCTTKIS